MVPEKSPEVRLYSLFVEPRIEDGVNWYLLKCSEVCYFGFYLDVVLAKQSKFPGTKLSIPHRLVSLIADKNLPKDALGFD